MDNTFLYGLVVVVMLGVGWMGGMLTGRSRQRLLQRKLDEVYGALQHSQNETQQREGAWQRSQQEGQQVREELHRCQQELLRSQEETGQYRTQVTQHFTQTADLLQSLTLNYRAVYEHLAVGAAALCDGQVKTLTAETLRERLLAPPSEETTSEGGIAPPPLAAVPDGEQQPLPRSQDAADPEKTKRRRINSGQCGDSDDGKTQKLVHLPFGK